jgi:competence protein ComEA
MPAMNNGQRARYLAGYMVLAALLATIVFMVVARRPPGQSVVLPDPSTPAPLRVHVVGAVMAPGVYALPPGSIAQDAVDAAGGPTREANLQGLNLAALLRDGEQVNVPALAAAAGTNPPVGGAAPTPGPGSSTLINVNTASAAELESLPKIGPALAQRIVDYRTSHGAFVTLDDLLNVDGIGPATLDTIRDFVTL